MNQDSDHTPAFLFDLDGTLIDSVYQHVLAWHEALEEVGFSLGVWRIHRRIGMSGGLLVHALSREIGQRLTPEQAEALQERHAAAFARYRASIPLLPGARELLKQLSRAQVRYAIATSGRREGAQRSARKIRSNGGDPGHHTAGGPARKAGSGPVSCRSRAAQRTHHESDGCGRQRVGSVGCSKSRLFRNRTAFRRLRKRRTGTGRRLSRVSGSGGFADTPR